MPDVFGSNKSESEESKSGGSSGSGDVYEVLSNELTLHKDVRTLKNPTTGEVTGRQLGLGKVYHKGEVVPASEIGQVYKDILDDEDNPAHEKLSKKLKKGSGDPSTNLGKRLGVPFAEYDEMEEDDIVTAMRHLPSRLIQRIKEYEGSDQGGNRDKIVNYNIGFGSDPDARAEGRVGAVAADEGDRAVKPEDKPTAKLTTRNVPEEGEITHGEGYTGTGEGKIPYGSKKEEAEGEGDGDKKPAARRSRRTRSSG